MTRYLIVNADDCGLSAGINRGILEVHQGGIVTSTTVIINMPDAADGIRLLQQEAPMMGIGLHFNITHGKPVAPVTEVRSLVNSDGQFYTVQEFYNGRKEQIDGDEFRREMRAQLDRFVAYAGYAPDHLDSHHGTSYTHPAALAELLQIASEYRIPIRSGENVLKDEKLKQVFDSHPKPRWPDFTQGGFYGDTASAATLLTLLPDLPEGVSEMVCHPGYAHDVDEAYKEPREDELRALTDPRVREMLRRENIQLVTFGFLKAKETPA